MIRKPMSAIIQRICPDVVVVCDGKEAWEAYQQREFTLVITDLQMPRMNGSELIEKIRSKKSSQMIAVVSAYCDGEEIESAKKHNVNYIIIKPLSLPLFIEMIMAVVEQIP